MFENNMHRERSGRAPYTRTAMAWVAALALAAGALKYDIGDKLFDTLGELLPENTIDLSVQPPVVVASVDQESYKIERTFDLTCRGLVSAAIEVQASQEAWGSIFGYSAARATVEKRYEADFLACGDNDQLEVGMTEIINPITDEVTDVNVVLPNIFGFHYRLQMSNPANCVDGNPGDTNEDIDRKIAEREEAIASGESPDCDTGFAMGDIRRIGPGAFADLPTEAQKAAEIAVEIDSNPRIVTDQIESDWINEVREELLADPRYSDQTNIDISFAERDEQTLEARVAGLSRDYGLVFPTIELRNGNKELYLESASGVQVTVQLGSYVSVPEEFTYELKEFINE